MNHTVSEKELTALERFALLASRAANAGVMSRVTFSRPMQSDGDVKTVVTLYSDKDELMLRCETSRVDGKVIRKNRAAAESHELFAELAAGYKQGNLTVGGAEAQYMVSKKGKSTLVGERAVESAIESADGSGSRNVRVGADDKSAICGPGAKVGFRRSG